MMPSIILDTPAARMPHPATRHAIATTHATLDDLDALALLFDAYRVFYRQPSNLAAARSFIAARMQNGESVTFLARDADTAAASGFVQLYPSFSSVSVARIWILNDLYVAPDARRRGVAHALMERARAFAKDTGASRLVLETAEDNRRAQALYESLGYVRELGERHYALTLA